MTRTPRLRGIGAPVLAAFVLAALLPSRAEAQQPASREADLTSQQAERAKALVPQGPNKAEKLLTRIEPVVLATEPTGFYPWFGSVLGGGWLAAGAGYRLPFADTGRFNVYGGWSLKNYRTIDATLLLPTFFDGRGKLIARGKYLLADKVSFYGLGPDSDQDDETSFAYEPTTFGADVEVEALPYVFVGAGYGVDNVKTGGGQEGTSIEERFTTEAAPGLGQDVSYGVTRVSLAIDWRNSETYNTHGGLLRGEFRRYAELDDKPYGFEWAEVEVRQYLPILRENWVLAFRGLATFSTARDGDQVPYFMMPTLGSSKDLRGFSNRRFRDVNRILLQGEYRWRPSRFMDLIVFYDAGKVASSRGDLDLDDLETSWGGGVRLHGPAFTALRLEVAKSHEGLKFIVSQGIF